MTTTKNPNPQQPATTTFSLKNSSQFLFENRFTLPMYHGNGFRSSASVKRRSASSASFLPHHQPTSIQEEIEIVCEKRSRHSVTDEFSIPFTEIHKSTKLYQEKTQAKRRKSSVFKSLTTGNFGLERPSHEPSSSSHQEYQQDATSGLYINDSGEFDQIENLTEQELYDRELQARAENIPVDEMNLHEAMKRGSEKAHSVFYNRVLKEILTDAGSSGIFVPTIPNDPLCRPEREERPAILSKGEGEYKNAVNSSTGMMNQQQQGGGMNNGRAHVRSTRYCLYEVCIIALCVARWKKPLRRKQQIAQRSAELKRAQQRQLKLLANEKNAHNHHQQQQLLLKATTATSTSLHNSPCATHTEFSTNEDLVANKLEWLGGDSALLSKREQTRHAGASMTILWDAAQASFLDAQQHRIASARETSRMTRKEALDNKHSPPTTAAAAPRTDSEKAASEKRNHRKINHEFFTTASTGRALAVASDLIRPSSQQITNNNNIHSNSSTRPGTARTVVADSSEQNFRLPTKPMSARAVGTANSSRARPFSAVSTLTSFSASGINNNNNRPSTVPSALNLARATSAQIKRRQEEQKRREEEMLPKVFDESSSTSSDDDDDEKCRKDEDDVCWKANDQQHPSPRANLGDFFFSLSAARKRQQQQQQQEKKPSSPQFPNQHQQTAQEPDLETSSLPTVARQRNPKQFQPVIATSSSTAVVQIFSPEKSAYQQQQQTHHHTAIEPDPKRPASSFSNNTGTALSRKNSEVSSTAFTTGQQQQQLPADVNLNATLSRQGSGLLRRRSSSLLCRSRQPHPPSTPGLRNNTILSTTANRIVTNSCFFLNEEDVTVNVPTMSAFTKESAATIRMKKSALDKRRKKSPSPDPVASSSSPQPPNFPPSATKFSKDISSITKKIRAQEKQNQQKAKEQEDQNPTKAKSSLKGFLTDYRGNRFEIDENSAALVQSACHDRKWGKPKKRDFVLQAIDRCGPDSQFKSSQQALRMILDGSKRYNEYLLRRVALEKELETRREWLKAMLQTLKEATAFSSRVPNLILNLVIPALLPSQFCVRNTENALAALQDDQDEQDEINRYNNNSPLFENDEDDDPHESNNNEEQQHFNDGENLLPAKQEMEKKKKRQKREKSENEKRAERLWRIVASHFIDSSRSDIITFLLRTELTREEFEPKKDDNNPFLASERGSSSSTTLALSNNNNDDDDDAEEEEKSYQQQQQQQNHHHHQLGQRKSTTTKQLTDDIRLPILSYENFTTAIFEKIPESDLLYPDVQLMLRCLIRGFNVNYSQLRKLFSDRNLHFHLIGNVGM